MASNKLLVLGFNASAILFSSLGFLAVVQTPLFFVFHQQSDIIYLLLYVDDIIITSNDSSLLDSFARKLNSEFASKDLGSLSYFLGLEATSTTDGFFISQLKYAWDILTRARLLDSKPVHTPMIVSQHLTRDGPAFSDPTLYRSLVGAFQYLTITRPDIAHVVNSVSQFLHGPTADHFLAVKRILHYVKGTLHFGLTFRLSDAPGALVAYSDADWASCPDTRCSISSYSIYLTVNLSIEPLPLLQLNSFGSPIYFMILRFPLHRSLFSRVTTKVRFS